MDSIFSSSEDDNSAVLVPAEELALRIPGIGLSGVRETEGLLPYLFPSFEVDDEVYFLRFDLQELEPVVLRSGSDSNLDILSAEDRGILTSYTFPNGDELIRVDRSVGLPPQLYPGLRNLISRVENGSTQTGERVEIRYFGGCVLRTRSELRANVATQQLQRASRVTKGKEQTGFFANSAYYMGSKRELAEFLVEALASDINDHTTILDLMCGSGAASQAFSTQAATIASDAQEFCRILARVQGAGFDLASAREALSRLETVYEEHLREVKSLLQPWLEREEEFILGDATSATLRSYRGFIERTAWHPSPEEAFEGKLWDLLNQRKMTPSTKPFLLFTAYFSNTYFGLRQAVEIDSLRYAIEKELAGPAREWALGALVAAVSYIGSTFAAHFAQPVSLSEKNLSKILGKRARSVYHEFVVRFQALAKSSEASEREIELVPGPWEHALAECGESFDVGELLVYVDAPYKREEYGRYYHVLETLVRYHYPSAQNKGLVPSKKGGGRFSSRFFTRSTEQMNQELADVISRIVQNGWIAAWSYSDNATGSIPEVVRQVDAESKVKVRSYAAPYSHQPQGGPKSREVTEYLVLFSPE